MDYHRPLTANTWKNTESDLPQVQSVWISQCSGRTIRSWLHNSSYLFLVCDEGSSLRSNASWGATLRCRRSGMRARAGLEPGRGAGISGSRRLRRHGERSGSAVVRMQQRFGRRNLSVINGIDSRKSCHTAITGEMRCYRARFFREKHWRIQTTRWIGDVRRPIGPINFFPSDCDR